MKPSKASKSPGVPTLFLTDLHYGEVVDPAQVGGVNSYNVESRASGCGRSSPMPWTC